MMKNFIGLQAVSKLILSLHLLQGVKIQGNIAPFWQYFNEKTMFFEGGLEAGKF